MKKMLASFLFLTLGISLVWAGDNYQQMDRLFRAKQYQDLEDICQTRLKANPKSLDSYYFLSLMKLNQGKGQDAVSSMLAFEKYHGEIEESQQRTKGKNFALVDSYYVDLYYFLGQYYVGQKKYNRALYWLDKAKTHYSDDPMLHFFMGRSYAGQGNYDQAVKSFQKQAQLTPKDPTAPYNIACCYAEEGKEGDAVGWLKKAIAANPKYRDQIRQDDSFKKIKSSKAFQDLVASK